MITCFEPIADKHCEILILGSMPGGESLRQQQYYAFKRNQFWKIIFELFDEEYSDDYEVKKQTILKHHIALWDVLKSCEREGSLDSNIKNEDANDFQNFFKKYPNIKHVFFNGTKAQQSFKRYIGFDTFPQLEYTLLPSTSPAHTIKFQKKLEDWYIIKEVLSSN